MVESFKERDYERLASCMSLSFFLRRLLFHVALAALVLFAVLLIGEIFVPGSVLPFIDLVNLTLGLVALLILAALFPVGPQEE